jgi:hypothetical protein
MSSPYIPLIKQALGGFSRRDTEAIAREILAMDSPRAIRDYLAVLRQEFAAMHP